ncbi:MAG: DUF1223 domain-containing protein [Rhodospirillales bacterium]|nr:DUF1223 domain-containing protein [Rhodospirillales bacterium]
MYTPVRYFLAAMLIAFAPGIGGANAASSSDSQKVVVELYTSQGCSSCPPADEFLSELAGRDGVLALSFHVDYWNYIGWRDPYSDPKWTKRQQAYGQNLQKRYVYTPQMVIDGRTETVGSKRRQVDKLIARAGDNPKLKIEVGHPDRDNLHIRIPGSAKHDGAPATIWLALYDASHDTEIKSGENKGETITNANVVRSMSPVGTWRGKALNLSLQLADFGVAGRDGCAILVQEKNIGRILGAIAIPLTTKHN